MIKNTLNKWKNLFDTALNNDLNIFILIILAIHTNWDHFNEKVVCDQKNKERIRWITKITCKQK